MAINLSDINTGTLDAQLTDIAGLTPTDNAVIIGNGTNFVVESGATLKTSLGLTIGTDVQAYDVDTTKNDVINTFTLINQATALTLATGATCTPNANDAFQTFTTSANFTIAAPTNRPSAGNLRNYVIKIIYAGAHSATSLNAVYKYNGTAPAFSNTSGKYDLLICADDGTDISYELKAGYTS